MLRFFFIFFVLFCFGDDLLGREREREREEEERETLGYGLENVNLEIFLFILYLSMLLFLSQQIDFRETWVSDGSEFASYFTPSAYYAHFALQVIGTCPFGLSQATSSLLLTFLVLYLQALWNLYLSNIIFSF